MKRKIITRVDVFANMGEAMKFLEWAKKHNPKTQEDMNRLLAKYKKPDLFIDASPEAVEDKVEKGLKVARLGTPKKRRQHEDHN